MPYLARVAFALGAALERLWSDLAPPGSNSEKTFVLEQPLPAAAYCDPSDGETLFGISAWESPTDHSSLNLVRVDAGTLTNSVRRAARATLVGKHWPPSSGRQVDSFVVRMLCRAGWPADEVIGFNLTVYRFHLPNFDDVDGVRREVMDAFTVNSEGPAGLVAEAIGKDVVLRTQTWLNGCADPEPESTVLNAPPLQC